MLNIFLLFQINKCHILLKYRVSLVIYEMIFKVVYGFYYILGRDSLSYINGHNEDKSKNIKTKCELIKGKYSVNNIVPRSLNRTEISVGTTINSQDIETILKFQGKCTLQ